MSDNELIAEFMGWEKYTNAYGNAYKCPNVYPIENSYKSGWTTFTQEQLEFNVRWDWLMPVVEKIEDECFMNVIIECAVVTIEGNLTDEKGIDIAYYTKQTPYQRQEQTKIALAHEAVVIFIKWYNTQKP